ncbi:transmembrane protein 268 isoform X2 [Ascaphus truei]|uniref:transmembrane protein 268 isoform X2 n=1 Tax=Ascaphus truei TaxID=8439 RepID=UPI003F5AA23B
MTPDAEGSDPETDDNLSCDWSPEPATNSATRLYNGRLLTVLTYASRGEHLDQCLQNLRACGVQVSLEQCRGSLQISPLIPELCRYVFFSSRVFGMALALINVNTDVRLSAANEIFMEHNVLLGVSDGTQKCHSVPSLCFVYFNLQQCQRRLSECLAGMRKDALRRHLDQLCIVVEAPADPAVAQEGPGDATTEQSPLLPSGSTEKPILCSKKIPLIHQGEPQVRPPPCSCSPPLLCSTAV